MYGVGNCSTFTAEFNQTVRILFFTSGNVTSYRAYCATLIESYLIRVGVGLMVWSHSSVT